MYTCNRYDYTCTFARALLRLGAPNLDGSQETATNKFGCPVEDVRELLQEAQRLGISVDGVR